MHLTQSRLSGFDSGSLNQNQGKDNKNREKNHLDVNDDDFLE